MPFQENGRLVALDWMDVLTQIALCLRKHTNGVRRLAGPCWGVTLLWSSNVNDMLKNVGIYVDFVGWLFWLVYEIAFRDFCSSTNCAFGLSAFQSGC